MKIKTKHIITCIKCLFLGLVMALPFIAVLPTALYYGFNEHAQSGDKVEYQYQTNEINTFEDLKIGNVYKILYDESTSNFNLLDILVDADLKQEQDFYTIDIEYRNQIRLLWDDTYTTKKEEAITNLQLSIQYNEESDSYYMFYLNVYNTKIEQNIDNDYILVNTYTINNEIEPTFYFTFVYTQDIYELFINGENSTNLCIENKTLTKADYIGEPIVEETINNQNALEIAFNNVFTTKGFNWVSNSIIATPIYAFVGAFGLTNDLFLSNLIVYWTNILLIYAILNIVLVVFTKLTQLGKKKEED